MMYSRSAAGLRSNGNGAALGVAVAGGVADQRANLLALAAVRARGRIRGRACRRAATARRRRSADGAAGPAQPVRNWLAWLRRFPVVAQTARTRCIARSAAAVPTPAGAILPGPSRKSPIKCRLRAAYGTAARSETPGRIGCPQPTSRRKDRPHERFTEHEKKSAGRLRGARARRVAARLRHGARAAEDEGRGHLHGAGRAAVGVAHPQGVERRRRPRRDRVQVLGERQQRRLRARDAPVRRAGQRFHHRRVVRRRSGGAQGREGLSEGVVPDGLVGQAAGAQPRRVRQLHPGARVPLRDDRRRHDQVEHHRHGRRLSDSGSEPADERVHGRREGSQSRR